MGGGILACSCGCDLSAGGGGKPLRGSSDSFEATPALSFFLKALNNASECAEKASSGRGRGKLGGGGILENGGGFGG
ncbi:hypothetical protein M7I_4669 [Glarea lozoyensis 74030]|uniref:Uncharacterized protein n=1 Tax=Glarea lozoyensis (strain ATCC 74030 / MF5533) TaxID=1104152 RepID=H0EPT2_GLAL7|nr:hypothetical protein M7I_4669 [Glarea lozoyensis 74030]